MKILVVDDEPSLRKLLAESIRLEGHEVVTAADGCQGLEIFKAETPDLIMTDINMPRMNGLEFLSAIRERDREVIVIIFTGVGSEENVLEAFRRNANDYLRKPIQHQVLFPLLAKYAGIVEAKTLMQETLGFIVAKNFVLKFDNRLEMVPHIVNQIIQEAGDVISGEQRLGIRIGMAELIINAIEHGNLGITYEEKQAALEKGTNGLEVLVSERLGRSELANRRVTVESWITRDNCRWLVSDEGEGFDWEALPKPLAHENLEQPNGRGIFLARMQFDQLEFLGKGNQVQMTKQTR